MHGKHHKSDFILGAMIGSTLGAFSAILSNPNKRNKIKKELMNKYQEFQTAVKKFVNQSKVQTKVKKIKRKLTAHKTTQKRRRKNKK